MQITVFENQLEINKLNDLDKIITKYDNRVAGSQDLCRASESIQILLMNLLNHEDFFDLILSLEDFFAFTQIFTNVQHLIPDYQFNILNKLNAKHELKILIEDSDLSSDEAYQLFYDYFSKDNHLLIQSLLKICDLPNALTPQPLNLINIPSSTNNGEPFFFYRTCAHRLKIRRNNSYIQLNDKLFEEKKILDENKKSLVRIFSSNNQLNLIVKSPKIRYAYKETLKDAQKELDIYRLLYPELTFNLHEEPNNEDFRLVMESFNKDYESIDSLIHFIYKTKESENALIKQLQTLLSICNILSRLHNLGLIHGDLGYQNILIKEDNEGIISAFLIDFEHSISLIPGHSAIVTIDKCDYWAPERVIPSVEHPHPESSIKQDIFSLAYCMDMMSRNFSPLLKDCLSDFIKLGTNPDPELRPELSELQTSLSNLYHQLSESQQLSFLEEKEEEKKEEEPDEKFFNMQYK